MPHNLEISIASNYRCIPSLNKREEMSPRALTKPQYSLRWGMHTIKVMKCLLISTPQPDKNNNPNPNRRSNLDTNAVAGVTIRYYTLRLNSTLCSKLSLHLITCILGHTLTDVVKSEKSSAENIFAFRVLHVHPPDRKIKYFKIISISCLIIMNLTLALQRKVLVF